MPACGLPSATERAARFHGDVRKLSVFLVLIQSAGGGIVGDVNIGPAVVVEIGGQNAEAVGAVGAKDSRGFGNVGERAIAVVVIQNVLAALQAGRPACHHHAFV